MSHECASCGSSFTRADNLRRHAASGTCSGIALQRRRSPLENSLGTYSPVLQGTGLGYGETSSETSDSDNREVESDRDPPDEDMSEEEEEETYQDVTDGEDDDMSDERSHSGDSSDDYEDENTDASSEDEAMSGPQAMPSPAVVCDLAFKHYGNARYRIRDDVVYAAWKSRKNIPYVVQQREWLNTLRNSKPERWRQLLNDASDSQLEAFREIAYNVIRRRVVMSRRAMLGLDKNSDEISKLAHIDNSYEQLRHLLKQGRTGVVLRLLMWGLPRCIKSNKAV